MKCYSITCQLQTNVFEFTDIADSIQILCDRLVTRYEENNHTAVWVNSDFNNAEISIISGETFEELFHFIINEIGVTPGGLEAYAASI